MNMLDELQEIWDINLREDNTATQIIELPTSEVIPTHAVRYHTDLEVGEAEKMETE